MTEQELRQEFKNHSDCYSDAFEVIQAMTEDAAIALAKAYADARVAETIEGWKITREHLQNQVSAKDTEIAELKAQVEGLKTDMQHSRLIEAAQVKESNELKAEIKRLRDGVKDQLKDIERMQRGGMKTSFLVFGGRLRRLLSPAPVTETQNEEQV